MSDIANSVRDLSRSAGVIFVGIIIGQALGLFGEILIANILPPTEYGNLSLAYTIAILTGTVTLFGIHNGVTRMMTAFEEQKQKRRVFYHAHLLIFLLSGFAVLSLLGLRDYIGILMNEPELPRLLILFTPLIMINPIRYITYGALRVENRAGAAVISKDIVGRTIPLILLAGTALLSYETVGAITYWLGFPLVTVIVSAYYLRDNYRYKEILNVVPNREIISQLWSFSWPLAISAFIFILLSHMDIIMIGYFLQSDSVGYYRSVQPLREASTFAAGAFSFVFMPIATEYFEDGSLEELERLYIASTKWVMIATFPLVLVLGLLSGDIVRIAIGSEYQPAAPVLTILVFGLFFRSVVGLNGDVVKAIDRTRIELISAMIGLGANFLLNIVLIPTYGIQGAAIATVIGYVVYNCAEVIAIYQAIRIHPFSVNNIKPLIPPLLFGVIATQFLSPDKVGPIYLGVIAIIIGIVQLISPFITGGITEEDIYLIREVEQTIGVQLLYFDK